MILLHTYLRRVASKFGNIRLYPSESFDLILDADVQIRKSGRNKLGMRKISKDRKSVIYSDNNKFSIWRDPVVKGRVFWGAVPTDLELDGTTQRAGLLDW